MPTQAYFTDNQRITATKLASKFSPTTYKAFSGKSRPRPKKAARKEGFKPSATTLPGKNGDKKTPIMAVLAGDHAILRFVNNKALP
jgi:hypothetical protein